MPKQIKDLRERFVDHEVRVLGTYPVLQSTYADPQSCQQNPDYLILDKSVVDKLGWYLFFHSKLVK